MKYFIDVKIQGSNIIEKIFADCMPAPFLSILTNDCIAKGKDYNAGGARYNTKYLQGVGIGTITDCLAAVKYNVYDKKNFTMDELMAALDDNFIGHERILNLVKNHSPKYGNDDEYADEIMKQVFEYYQGEVTGRPNMLGGMYRVNMLPTTWTSGTCTCFRGYFTRKGCRRKWSYSCYKVLCKDGSFNDRRYTFESEVYTKCCCRRGRT